MHQIPSLLRGSEPVTNDDLNEAFRIHSQEEMDNYDKMMNKFMEAFPDGDLSAHRQYHSSKIEAAKAEKEFWMAAKQELMRRGISGILHLIALIAILALVGFASKYGIAFPFLPKGP